MNNNNSKHFEDALQLDDYSSGEESTDEEEWTDEDDERLETQVKNVNANPDERNLTYYKILNTMYERIHPEDEEKSKYDIFRRSVTRHVRNTLNTLVYGRDWEQRGGDVFDFFKEDGPYRFTVVHEVVIDWLWRQQDTQDSKNFVAGKFDDMSAEYIFNLMKSTKYFIIGYCDDKIDLNKLEDEMYERFFCNPPLDKEKALIRINNRVKKAYRELRNVIEYDQLEIQDEMHRLDFLYACEEDILKLIKHIKDCFAMYQEMQDDSDIVTDIHEALEAFLAKNEEL